MWEWIGDASLRTARGNGTRGSRRAMNCRPTGNAWKSVKLTLFRARCNSHAPLPNPLSMRALSDGCRRRLCAS